MNNEFIELLEMEYRQIKLQLSKTSIEGKGTPQEIADRREEIFHSFFEKYFPFPYRVTKGNIIDSYNNRSASIDCIILDPSHPYTIDKNNNKASVIFADGVDYAIEIKGALCNKNEIVRTLEQVETVKKLTRVRSGIINKENRTEYTYKIPTIVYAEKTYVKIETLIEIIINYYKENKIKRLHQFDIIIAGDYTIMNACKGYMRINGGSGIFIEKTKNKTLAVLLFLMTNIPLVQPIMNENIYNIYLKNICSNLRYSDEWNKTLKEIEES